MSDYQINGWKLSDFKNADVLLGMRELTPVSLNQTAESFCIDVKDRNLSAADLSNRAKTCAVTGSDVTIGNVTYPTGAGIVLEYTLKTGGAIPTTLIIAHLYNDLGRTAPTSERIILTSGPFEPGQEIALVSCEPYRPTGPGQDCFARGTLIETPHGALPIEHLEDGDEVLCQDGSTSMITWVGQQRFSGLELILDRRLRPVRIMAGALTGGRPGQDLVVSQNHRMLVDDWRAPYLFGEEEILAPAKSLLNNKNVFIDCPLGGVDYFQLLVEGRNMVCANGLWAETMTPDQTALSMLNPAQNTQVLNVISQDTPANSHQTALPALAHQSAEAFLA